MMRSTEINESGQVTPHEIQPNIRNHVFVKANFMRITQALDPLIAEANCFPKDTLKIMKGITI